MHDQRTQFSFLVKVTSWEELGGKILDIGATTRQRQRERLDEEGRNSLQTRICTPEINFKLEPKHIYHNAWSKNTIYISSEGDKLRGIWRRERCWSFHSTRAKRAPWEGGERHSLQIRFCTPKSTLSLSQSIFIIMRIQRTQFSSFVKVLSRE